MPVDVMRETLRRFDRHRRQLLISELIDGPGLAFQLAFQIGLSECSGSFDTIVGRAGPLDDTPRRLYRITLANYFAAAVMMPYQVFHSAAESLSYDVHVLAQRFNAGFEQVCHRLTTLQRPNARGVPFSCCGSTTPAMFRSDFLPAPSRFRNSAAPAPCGTCTRPSTRRTACSSR